MHKPSASTETMPSRSGRACEARAPRSLLHLRFAEAQCKLNCRYNPSENMGYKKEGRDCPRPSLMWLRVRVLETSRQHKIPATVRHVDAGDGAHRIDAGRQLIPVGVVHA